MRFLYHTKISKRNNKIERDLKSVPLYLTMRYKKINTYSTYNGIDPWHCTHTAFIKPNGAQIAFKTLVFSALVSMSRRRVFHVILWLAFASAFASEFVLVYLCFRCCCCCCCHCRFYYCLFYIHFFSLQINEKHKHFALCCCYHLLLCHRIFSLMYSLGCMPPDSCQLGFFLRIFELNGRASSASGRFIFLKTSCTYHWILHNSKVDDSKEKRKSRGR